MRRAGVALILLGVICVLQAAVVVAIHLRPQAELLSLAMAGMSVPFIAGGVGLLSADRMRQRQGQPPPTAQEIARRLRTTALGYLGLAAWNLVLLAPRRANHDRWVYLAIGLFWLVLGITTAFRSSRLTKASSGGASATL